MNPTNNSALQQFILDASRATYASGDESLKQKQVDGSTTIEFKKGEYTFHDNYFGGEPYGGREVIFFKGQAIWMMVYYGLVYPNTGLQNKEVYSFLIAALSASTLEMPYRGPASLVQGDWQYTNELQGDVANFSGVEKIFKNGICVYEASYRGGLVNQ